MKNSKNLIYLFVSLVTIVLLFSFKSIPSGQLWKGYTVLYVPSSINDSAVTDALHTAEIKDVVSLNGQYLPLNLPADSIEVAMYRINSTRTEYSYIQKRNLYFFDKSNSYRLYYIPNQYKNKLPDAIEILNSKHIESGVDTSSTYPWFLPVFFALFSIFLFFNSTNGRVFAAGAVPLLLYLICNPFYPIAVSECMCLLSVFYISNVWRRKGALPYLLANHMIPVMVVCSLICAFACSVKSGFLFLLTLCGIYSVLKLYLAVEDYLLEKKSFVALFIRPAKMISLYAGKPKKIMPITCAFASLFLLFFLFTSSDSISSHFSKIQLPSAKGVKAEELPLLTDYYDWVWKVKSYPYQSINSESKDPESIQFPRFKDAGTKITESKDLMVYNQSFKDKTLEEIDTLKFPSVEKLLKTQGKDFSASYASSNSYHLSFFSIIMMIICFFILLFICISIIMTKSRKQ